MRYTFYTWRARKAPATEWRELGWCMTEEDARKWAKEHGHEIECIGPAAEKRFDTPAAKAA